MKALKIFSTFTAVILMSSVFSNGIAQTFGDSKNAEETYISPRQKLIIELLKAEMKTNTELKGYADAINEELNNASEYDYIDTDCYKYTPLLVDAVNSKAKFINFFYIQGNFKYSFEIDSSRTEAFNFYEWYEDNKLIGLLPSVSINGNGIAKNFEDEKATDYISKNYCQPLNRILDQNKNLSIPQLLSILRQRFSK